MRKTYVKILLLFLVIAVMSAALCACTKVPDNNTVIANGAMQVSEAMTRVYTAMRAADGSVSANVFSMSASGTLATGSRELSYTISGNFDISNTNRTNDTASELLLEIKEGSYEVLAIYYSAGKLYLHYPPYASRAVIDDFNLAEVVYELYQQKTSGELNSVIELIPTIGNYIFKSCNYTSDGTTSTYAFTLSYAQLFDSISTLLTMADIGIDSTEFIQGLGLNIGELSSYIGSTASVSMYVVNNKFTGCKFSGGLSGSTNSFNMSNFLLAGSRITIGFPSSLNAFTGFSIYNWNISGTATVKAAATDSTVNIGRDVSLNSKLVAATYTYAYQLQSNYSDGELQLYLQLTDPNNKTFSLYLNDGYIYLDLSAFGLGKIKTARDTVKDNLKDIGVLESGGLTFAEKIRLFAHISAGRSKSGEVVSYSLDETALSLILKQIGYDSLFKFNQLKFSIDTTNNRIKSVSAGLTLGGISFNLAAATPVYGAAVTVTPPINLGTYSDIDNASSYHYRLSGQFSASCNATSASAVIETLIDSITGDEVVISTAGVSKMNYTADFVLDKEGRLDLFQCEFRTTTGLSLITLYYNSSTANTLYLMYPESGGITPVTVHEIPQEGNIYQDFFNALSGKVSETENSKISILNTATQFSIAANYAFVQQLITSLKGAFPSISSRFLSLVDYTSLCFTLNSDSVDVAMLFADSGSLNATITSAAFTVNDTIGITSYDLAAKSVGLLANNDMPNYVQVTFGNGAVKKLSALDSGGVKLWQYDGVPTATSTAGSTTQVTASINLLGFEVSTLLTVDLSPSTAATVATNSQYSSKYNVNTRTFTFDRYNDDNPTVVIPTFGTVLVTTAQASYNKNIVWDLSGINTASASSSFTIIPKVATYFANYVALTNNTYTVAIQGGKAASTDYIRTFTAYDGCDPLDPAVYSDVLNITTSDGAALTVFGVQWELTNTTLAPYISEGRLYSYSGTTAMRAKVFDCMGNHVTLSIPVVFVSKVLTTYDFNVAEGSGVTYDSESGFTFDVIKIRGLTSSSILPNSLVANSGTGNMFAVEGIKWEFTPVSGILNTAGTSGIIKLIIGDSISGYQQKSIAYQFTSLNITATALADKDKVVIQSKDNRETMYSYTMLSQDPYSYRYPKYIRLTYQSGSEDEYYFIEADWIFNSAFDENTIYAGAAYQATANAGSDIFTLQISFVQKRITAYQFSSAQLEIGGETAEYAEHLGKMNLIYLAYSAISDSAGLDYTDTASYPSKMMVRFNGGSEWVEVDVTWNLTAFNSKTDIIGNGFSGTVTASAKGQSIAVNVYVEPAVGDSDTVYTSSAKTSRAVTFYLLKAVGGQLVITNPMDVDNYPSALYVVNSARSVEYEVSVVEWELGTAISSLYATGLAAGTAVNDISGSVSVRAKIGNSKVGYKYLTLEAAIVASTIRDIRLLGLPLSASSQYTGGSSQYAISVDNTAGTSGTFDYSLSVTINPYYVSPVSAASYPKQMSFYLNGVAITIDAVWDLSRVAADAAYNGNRYTYAGYSGYFGYPVYALIDTGDYFPDIKIGVEANIMERVIDKIWIDGSCQRYIDINGYDEAPFGEATEGDRVTMDVMVQFVNDSNKYPLKLIYNKTGIMLPYDGSATYGGISIEVGNDSGGYQGISGYTIRVISNIISSIVVSEEDRLAETDGYFYDTAYESEGSSNLIYTYNSVVDMSADLPSQLLISFGMGDSKHSRNVVQAKGDGTDSGLVYRWVRNAAGYLGIELWNSTTEQAGIGGAHQFIYSEVQDDYNSPSFSMLFNSSLWSCVYGDLGDSVTPARAIALWSTLQTKFAAEYQRIYITADTEGAEELSADTVLGAGTYRYCVEIIGHNHFRGTVYKVFEITPKDISGSVVILVGGAARRSSGQYDYRSSAYNVTATMGSYGVNIALLINGAASAAYTDAGTYNFTITVASAETNYTASVVSFITIAEIAIGFTDYEYSVIWAGGTFVASVQVFNVALEVDGTLTNGYVITYYSDIDCENVATSFTPGATYYYALEFKVPNYRTVSKLNGITAS